MAAAKEEKREALSMDVVLERYVGEMGRGQIVQFVLASLAWTVEAVQTLVMIFADRSPPWHYKASPATTYTIPPPCTSTSTRTLELEWEWVAGRSYSTVSQWGLVCGDQFKLGLIQSGFFVGCLLGAGLFGNMSDFIGRKRALALTTIVGCILGMLTAASPNFWVYLVLRALTGVTSGGLSLISFLLAVEPIGPTHRAYVGLSVCYFYALGLLLLSTLAYLSPPNWHYLYLITSIPSLLYCLIVLPFLFESPRWYIVRGRAHDALRVLQALATRNGSTLPSNISLAPDDAVIQKEEAVADQAEAAKCSNKEAVEMSKLEMQGGNLIDVFRIPSTRNRMVIMIFIWFSTGMVYYGLSLNVANLKTNLYLSVVVNGLAEAPAYTVTSFLVRKCGRRWLLVSTMLLSGISCMAGSVIFQVGSHSHSHSDMRSQNDALITGLRLACAAGGMFGVSGAYNLLYLYTSELFPTVVRNAALALASQAGQIGAVITPLVVLAGRFHSSIPFAVFGAASLLGGILAIRLSNTFDSPLYDTFQGLQKGEALHKNNMRLSTRSPIAEP